MATEVHRGNQNILFFILFFIACFNVATVRPEKHFSRDQLLERVIIPNMFELWLNSTKDFLSSRYSQMLSARIPFTLINTSTMSQCLNDTHELMNGVLNGSIWALKMADASTKLQPGLLEGNLVDLGQYDECTNVKPNGFKGQHCLIGINVLFNASIINVPKDLLSGPIVVTTSACIPSSCDSSTVELMINNELKNINNHPFFLLHGIQLTARVNPDDCHTKDTKPLTWGEYTVIGVCIMLLAIVFVSTVFDALLTRREGNRMSSMPRNLLRAFSVTQNLRRLLSTNHTEGVLPGINGARFICIAWVALGHRYKFICQNPLVNLLYLTDVVKQWSSMIIINATLSVDVFFLLGGLLNCYIYMRIPCRTRNCKMMTCDYIHRYLRLTPTYMLMIAITATWLYRLGDGPLWDRLVGSASNDCKTNWLPGILYINNYYRQSNYCMMQSWYLAADMQMFWLSPILLYPLYKWPRFGLGLGIVSVLISIFIPYYIAYVEEIAAPIPLSRNFTRVELEMDTLYLPTHTKTISYVLGILFGYLIYLIKANKIKWNLTIEQKVVGWIVAIVFMAGSLFGAYPLFQLDYVYNRWESPVYIGLYRLFWGLGVGWVILACVTGQAGIIGSLLNCKPFIILGRLTYGIYLTHVAVILYKVGSTRQIPFLSHYDQITQFLGEFIITTFCALILTLVSESPFLVMEKVVLRRGGTVNPDPNVNLARRPSNRRSSDVDEIGISNPGLAGPS